VVDHRKARRHKSAAISAQRQNRAEQLRVNTLIVVLQIREENRVTFINFNVRLSQRRPVRALYHAEMHHGQTRGETKITKNM